MLEQIFFLKVRKVCAGGRSHICKTEVPFFPKLSSAAWKRRSIAVQSRRAPHHSALGLTEHMRHTTSKTNVTRFFVMGAGGNLGKDIAQLSEKELNFDFSEYNVRQLRTAQNHYTAPACTAIQCVRAHGRHGACSKQKT